MNHIVLDGCSPQPLASYMKAMGVLRVVSEQRDPLIRGAWIDNCYILKSTLTSDDLVSFLMDDYSPTPIVGPWAGGSGFFGKDNRSAIDSIKKSRTERLNAYRDIIDRVQKILMEENQTEKPAESVKTRLIRRYRRELPDSFIDWFDSAIVLTGADQMFAPILGTGGNDGRLDFTQNFMQRIVDIGMPDERGAIVKKTRNRSLGWLRNALFNECCAGLLNQAVGQFDPGSVGGPNATQGMERNSIVNPWNYVLMMEGLVTMAGAVSRKMGSGTLDKAAFPFTVTASSAGASSVSQKDVASARAEVWLPLWNKFATCQELKTVFSEGRIELNGRQSRDGVEIARALASFGADRGLSKFIRYSFLKRSGKAYLAAPVSSFTVSPRQSVDLLQELDRMNWLDRFRKACKSERPAPPQRFISALRSLDDAIFDYCRRGDRSDFSTILKSLGRIERELAISTGKVGKMVVPPIPLLSPRWLEVSDDGSPEFRLAASIASIIGVSAMSGPLRYHLEPVRIGGAQVTWDGGNTSTISAGGSLPQKMLGIMSRRLLDASVNDAEKVPLRAKLPASLGDIGLFIDSATDDAMMEDYLWGCVLVDQKQPWPSVGHKEATRESLLPVSRLYAILKLIFLPSDIALKSVTDGKPVFPEISILNLLSAGQADRAAMVAARRLGVSGHIPFQRYFSSAQAPFYCGVTDTARLAASLIIPFIRVNQLKAITLRPQKNVA